MIEDKYEKISLEQSLTGCPQLYRDYDNNGRLYMLVSNDSGEIRRIPITEKPILGFRIEEDNNYQIYVLYKLHFEI